MNDKDLFIKIKNIVCKSENYVPRDYKTIGGMWTVETYKFLDITLQIMDEGYTNKIFTNDVTVIRDYENKIEYQKGDNHLLNKILNRLEKHFKKIEIEKEIEKEKMLKSKIIELNGTVSTDNDVDGSVYKYWGELIDDKYEISLSNLLVQNEGRKAKVIIQFED